MSSTVSAPTTATATLTTRNRVGIVLAVLLGIADVVSLAGVGATPAPGEEGPPDVVLIVGAVLGLVTIAAAVLAWVRHSRGGLRVAAVTRLLSMVLALPAFFVEGVPAPLVALVAALMVVSLASAALLVSRK